MKSHQKKIVLLFLMLLSSCFSRLEKRGYAFELSDGERLQTRITSKETAAKIMGSPTLISDLDDKEVWIYYAEEVNNFLFFKPKVEARNILVLTFDHEQNLSELKKINFDDEEKALIFSQNYTKVNSHQTGFFKSIFSNVGQIKAQ